MYFFNTLIGRFVIHDGILLHSLVHFNNIKYVNK